MFFSDIPNAMETTTINNDKIGTFEWIIEYKDIREYIINSKYTCIDICKSPIDISALVIGCGTSTLSFDIFQDLNLGLIVSIDNDSNCITHMENLYKSNANMNWYCYDIIEDLDVKQNNELDEDDFFNIIIDKVSIVIII